MYYVLIVLRKKRKGVYIKYSQSNAILSVGSCKVKQFICNKVYLQCFTVNAFLLPLNRF